MARRSAPRCEQVGRKRVPQRVRADAEPRAARGHVASHQPIDAARRQASAAVVEEQRHRARSATCGPATPARISAAAPPHPRDRVRAARAPQATSAAPVAQPGPQRGLRRSVERHQPLLAALAEHPHHPRRPGSRPRGRARPARSGAGPTRRTARGWRGRGGRAAVEASGMSSSVVISSIAEVRGQTSARVWASPTSAAGSSSMQAFAPQVPDERADRRQLARRRGARDCPAGAGRPGSSRMASRSKSAGVEVGTLAAGAGGDVNVRNCERSLS